MSSQTKSPEGISTCPLPLDLAHHFSIASKKRVPNVLKEYYKFLREPDMGNFAGGLPFPGSFPFDALDILHVRATSLTAPSENDAEPQTIRIPRSSRGLSSSTSNINLDTALQYGGAQGYPPLYLWLRKLVSKVYHPNIPYDGGADIMINSGSADGLWKVYELLFNHWDENVNDLRDRQSLLVEEFVYAPPVVQLKPRDANIVPVKMDGEGMLAYGDGSLCDVLQNWDETKGKRPHVVYIIPNGQNPTSGVLSFLRRKEIYEVCSKFDLILVEDDPYWNLYYPSVQSISMKYRGVPTSKNFPTGPSHNYSTQSLGGKSTGYQFIDELVPSFLSIDVDGRVIRLDSFSKTIAPGCRLGWVTAQPGICEQLFRITDGTTQQPSRFVQAIVAQVLGNFEDSVSPETRQSKGWGVEGWVDWLAGLRSTYEKRMIKMATILEENRLTASGSDGRQTEMFTFNWPMGGMFIWVKFQEEISQLMRLSSRTMDINFFDSALAAVDEDVLEAKSRSFVESCRDFWVIRDAEGINDILREEDALKSNRAGDDVGLDREVIEVW